MAITFVTQLHTDAFMHLPDHYIDPATSITTALLSCGAVAYAWFRVRRDPAAKAGPIAATGALIFAAQMVNFPVATGTSGHLVGGALAALLLGPWAGLLAMASVLTVQAAVFGDGGILALGANVLNMGVIGVLVGSACRAVPLFQLGESNLLRGLFSACAGWLSVVLGSLACALELTVSGTAPANDVVPAMVGIHALIGLPEAAITALVVALIGGLPADAAARLPGSITANRRGRLALIIAATIAIALTPLASALPDGLESVAERIGSFAADAPAFPSLFPDYTFSGFASAPAATALAGLLGVALVGCLTGLVCLAPRRHAQSL